MKYILLLSFISILFSCKEKVQPVPLSQFALLPKPVYQSDAEGNFTLLETSSIHIQPGSSDLTKLAQYLSAKLRPATGFEFKTTATEPAAESGNIYLKFSEQEKLGDEGYELSITPALVTLTGSAPAGIFRGIQTLLQLFPDAIAKKEKQQLTWTLPAGTVRDHPEYGFRSSMLDVSRHFFTVDEVKQFIDQISFYKINMLHLHLSDDQGWRIEIKSWPNLTAHGSTTQVGGGKGGFYTQDQYRDIVSYAQDRFITIIPEIDMPGHTNAALSSYPELNCNDTAPALYTKTEVGFSTFCVKKPVTYKFIDDVVRELAAITPGPYIHIGGDESHATEKNDYITFVNKIKDIPGKYGKKMIGWEEMAQGNLDSSDVIQFWTDTMYAAMAARKGTHIIISPAKKTYLDMKYDSTTKIGLEWAARIEVDSAYNWSPVSAVGGLPKENILGVEAPLWTETITNPEDIEYMVFPRLIGIAEIGWSSEKGKSWGDYSERLAKHGSRLKAMGINFYRSSKVAWKD